MRDHGGVPKPTELMENPQVAILVALDTTMLMAMRALLAVHTELLDGSFPRDTTATQYWADRLIQLGFGVEEALRKYREALFEERRPSSEPAF